LHINPFSIYYYIIILYLSAAENEEPRWIRSAERNDKIAVRSYCNATRYCQSHMVRGKVLKNGVTASILLYDRRTERERVRERDVTTAHESRAKISR
jgi:hypothetical protein